MIKFGIKHKNQYLKLVYNRGVNYASKPVPDFFEWSPRLDDAKLWVSRGSAENITHLHPNMKVVPVNITREVL